MQGKDSKGSNDCHLRRGEMLKILPLNIPMCYARSWTLSEHCVSTIPGETYYVLQPVRMHERARANHGEDFTEGGRFVCKMPGPACWCRAQWTASNAHCWNVTKHRKAWHGKGCRCQMCWDNLRRMCAGDNCRGRQLSYASVEAKNNAGQSAECRRRNTGTRWDPEPGRKDTQPDPEEDPEVRREPRKEEQFCYECLHYTYLGGNFCSNPSCKRKGWVRQR